MICPTCGADNLPGNEGCHHCGQDLTPFDRPVAGCRLERSLMEDPAPGLNMQPAVTVLPHTTVKEAISLLLDKNVGAVLVVDENQKLVGIFSERDLLKKIAGIHVLYPDMPVKSFMTPKPSGVSRHDVLAFVLHKMDGGGYRHVPVVENGKPIGILSVRDMLRHLTRLCK
ncbi:MAG: CBS domain-containing protein [Gemmataceae bacterium]|nr:CBS domain-containing protein [Gemmataceae bacterium]